MSQNDFGTIDPGTTSGSDLATLLGQFRDTVYSQHSGNARPAYVQAGQLWLDTAGSIWIWKIFDGTDDIIVGYVDPTLDKFTPSNVDQPANIVSSAVAVTLAVANNNLTYRFTSAVTVGIVDVATLPSGWHVDVMASGGAVIIDPNGGQQINGVATLTIPNGDSARIMKLGAGFVALIMPNATKLDKSAASVFAGFRNKLINGDGQISQRGYTTVADDVYWCDRHYVLTQTATITPSILTDVANDLPFMMRLSQSQASAQRMGNAQIVEAQVSKRLRGKQVTLGGKLRCSAAQAIRFAVLEWTGTADAPTSDVVASWTNGAFTAGNFFLGSNLTVAGVGAITPSAATVTDWVLTANISASCNNLIVFYWTEGTAAQNVTLDMVWGLVLGDASSETWPYDNRNPQQELALCQRFYEKSYNLADAPGSLTIGYVRVYNSSGSVNTASLRVDFRVTKRATPTITSYSPLNGASGNLYDGGGPSNRAASVAMVGQSGAVITNSATGNFGNYDVHWTADAEL